MSTGRCPARCSHCGSMGRRDFLVGASAASAMFLSGCLSPEGPEIGGGANPAGPASRCVPKIKACFVRRKGEYGMRWPGAVYDGKAARAKYTKLLGETVRSLNVKLDLRAEPIHSAQEADAWVAEAVAAKPDGLLVMLLDRQQHAWPTANKAIATNLPTVVFSPVGSSFTTNTAAPSRKGNCFICSTDDFSEVAYGLRMLHAGTKLRATRCLVLCGSKRVERTMPGLGIQLQYVPARMFLDEYRKTPDSAEVLALADDYMRRARRQTGPSRQDVVNSVKSYVVARELIRREQADAITMDCLGALGRSKVALPCIAWSRLNDQGIPAACEADLGAVASHTIVQYLFGRPGFQQDPVAETAREAIIGAHCCCATKLNGFDEPSEPFDLLHHHGNRDAVPRTVWRVGQRVTSADYLPARKGTPAKMLIAAGEVLDNVSVPPAGGCVVSVMVKFDGVTDVLAWPGFHQVFFYGDYKRHLVAFCRMYGIEPVIA